jgi:hypothetical protein
VLLLLLILLVLLLVLMHEMDGLLWRHGRR